MLPLQRTFFIFVSCGNAGHTPQRTTAAKPNQGRFADKKVIPNLALLLSSDRETVFNSLSALSGKPLYAILLICNRLVL